MESFPPVADRLYPKQVVAKKSILLEADEIIRDRQARYGPPREGYEKIVAMLNVLLERKLKLPLEPQDWPLMMVCQKLVRESYAHDRDNLRDVGGYVGCHAKTLGEDE